MALTLKAPLRLLSKNHIGEYSCRVTGVNISSSDDVALDDSLSPRERKTNSIHSASSSEDLKDESTKLTPTSPLNLALPNKHCIENQSHLDMPLDLSLQKPKINPDVKNNDVTPLDLTVNKTQNHGKIVQKSHATIPQTNVTSPQKSKTPPTYVCDNLFDLKLKIKRPKSHTLPTDVSRKVDAKNNKTEAKQVDTCAVKTLVSTRRNSCDVVFSNSVNNSQKTVWDDDVIIAAHQAAPPNAPPKEDFRKSFMPPLGSRKRPSPPITTDGPKLKKTSVNESPRSNLAKNEYEQKTVKYFSHRHSNQFPPNMIENTHSPTPFVPNILKKGKTLRQLTPHSNPAQTRVRMNVNYPNIPIPVRSLAQIKPKPFSTHLTTYTHRPQTTSLVHPSLQSHQLSPLMNVPGKEKRIPKLNSCVRSPPGGVSIVSTPLDANKPLINSHALALDYMTRQMSNNRYNNTGNCRPFNVGNNTIGYGGSKMYRPRQSQMTIDVNKAMMAARAVPKVSTKPEMDWSMNHSKPTRVSSHQQNHTHPLSPANLIKSKGRMPTSESQQQYVVTQRVQSADEPRRVCVSCKREAYYLCSGCKNMWYCSKHCQLNHWKSHSATCNSELTQVASTINLM